MLCVLREKLDFVLSITKIRKFEEISGFPDKVLKTTKKQKQKEITSVFFF